MLMRQILALMPKTVALRPQDVFSAYTYTGNGGTQTITNGVDLAGQGGAVCIKSRSNGLNHYLADTAANQYLITNATSGQQGAAFTGSNDITSLSSTGFTLGPNASATNNTNAATYVSWAFRKAPKFFEVVTYTGDDNFSGRQIAHNLGQAPGMIVVKKTSGSKDWGVWHRSLTDGAYLQLNSTSAQIGAGGFDYFGAAATQTATYFTLGDLNDDGTNRSGATYVAYLFAHDAGTDGLIQCGSFTTDGGGNGSFDFGWTAGVQYIELKCATMTGDWEVFDTARTPSFAGADARLLSNSAAAEDTVSRLSFSGTTLSFAGLSASQTYIFCAVRAP